MTDSLIARIAARLQRRPTPPDALEEAFARCKGTAEAPVYPAMADDTTAFFRRQAEQNLFEIQRVSDPTQAIAGLDSALPLALSNQPPVQALDWRQCRAQLTEDVIRPALAVVEASAGIAETGTVVVGSKEVASAQLFLCEELLILLPEDRIVAVQEELWRDIQPLSQRALHLISGPSRTADVEQTLQVGAHGPRRVYLWLLSQA